MIFAFAISFALFFVVAVWMGGNQEAALENRYWLGGVLFAIGIAPAIWFQGEDTGRGFRIALAWALGLVGGLGTALFLFAETWGLTP